MSSNVMEIIPDLNLPYIICQYNTHQTEAPAQNEFIDFTAPVSGDADRANGVGIVAADTELGGATVTADTELTGAIVPADTELTGAIVPADTELTGAIVPADTEKLLFKKTRDLWKVAESFEACRKMPKDPHFLPLRSCRKILREGQALGKMVTFDNIAKKISNLHPDTKTEDIEDDLSVLEELETHGFDVEMLKCRLNRMLLLKKQLELNKNNSEQIKKRFSGRDQEKRKIKKKRAKLEEKMEALRNQEELAAKMEEDINAKITSEQLAERVNHDKLCSINEKFAELVASLLS